MEDPHLRPDRPSAAPELWDDEELERAAWQHAVHGVPRYVIRRGQVVCDEQGQPVTRREYPVKLLRFMLRAFDAPRRYEELCGEPLPTDHVAWILSQGKRRRQR